MVQRVSGWSAAREECHSVTCYVNFSGPRQGFRTPVPAARPI